MEVAARAGGAQLVIANSHAVDTAHRLALPLLRAGFPQYDTMGGYARTWVGYRGSRQALFDIANLMLGQHHELEAYRSFYWSDDRDGVGQRHVVTSSATGLVH
ncbi:hypothetical protein SDC9_165436 [bioreactor metagenome]|uniref:Nitrogenase/oxidoreductase component 1 domain-containing protein n=2 Tax=root TaxID=1 RepID=A0A645FUB5_9ZZZZ